MARAKKAAALTPEERLQAALVPDWEWPYKLPENWCWTKLGVISAVKGGKRLPKGRNLLNNKTVHPYIRVTDFDSNSVIIEQVKYIDEETFHYIQNYTISSKDIYISIAGTIGKVGIIPDSFDGANLTENAAKITDINGINQKYLLWVLNSEFAQLQMKDSTISTTQPKLALFRIENIEIPIPPLAEQQRIVERIESLFAKLDEAKEKAQTVLDSFETRKAAILHKAFTGELTAKWRAEHDVEDESWHSLNFGDLIIAAKNGTTVKQNKEKNGYPVTRIETLQGGTLDFSRLGYIIDPETISPEDYYMAGDIAFSHINSAAHVGKTALIEAGFLPLIHGMNLLRIRLNEKCIPEYFVWYSRSADYKEQILQRINMAVNQVSINQKQLKTMPINVPKTQEQREIVRILDNLLAKEQQAREAAEAVLEKIDLLKKSILARAFRGELGTNDPNDEPAVELLKKIL